MNSKKLKTNLLTFSGSCDYYYYYYAVLSYS